MEENTEVAQSWMTEAVLYRLSDTELKLELRKLYSDKIIIVITHFII